LPWAGAELPKALLFVVLGRVFAPPARVGLQFWSSIFVTLQLGSAGADVAERVA